MTDKQYAAFKRSAFAAKKLETGKLAALDPRDLELIKSLLKDPDGYVKYAVAEKRSESQARQDIARCERVTRQTVQPACPQCETLRVEVKALRAEIKRRDAGLCPHGKRSSCEDCNKEVEACFG